MTISLLAVGDMMFDTRLHQPRVFFLTPEIATCAPGTSSAFSVPFVNSEESRRWLTRRGHATFGIELTSHAAESVGLTDVDPDPAYPFRAIRNELQNADIVFGNLECPLADRGRPLTNDQCYRASPVFAESLAAASFGVVSFANDHCMDYGEVAFLDTLDALHRNGIATVGAGASLDAARRPAVIEQNGVRVAFLGYTMVGPDLGFAVGGECGAAPLNTLVVAQDIRRIRLDVDHVVLSVHWGTAGCGRPDARLVDLAHQLVDAGADVILGHHPHVPGSIEIHRGRPIFYSLGSFCVGHDRASWDQNMMARLALNADGVSDIEIVALAGGARSRYQPHVLANGSAAPFHRLIDRLCRPFGTSVEPSGEGRWKITAPDEQP